MKKTIFSLLLLLFIISCQKEGMQLEEEATQAPVTLKNLTISNDDYSEREMMEINLRWTAFITGYVLRHSTEAQHEVATLLQNGNRVIKLNDLLTQNTTFNFAFRGYIADYLNIVEGNQVEPGADKPRPNPPPQGINGGESAINGNSINYLSFFINYISTENCIELYFPRSMNYRGEYSITTTGHSMNDKNFNDGIVRYYDYQLIDGHYITNENVTVNSTYLQNNANIIIARPYRITGISTYGADCSYDEYNDIRDFTTFLDY